MVALEGPHIKLKEKHHNYFAYDPSINTIRERERKKKHQEQIRLITTWILDFLLHNSNKNHMF